MGEYIGETECSCVHTLHHNLFQLGSTPNDCSSGRIKYTRLKVVTRLMHPKTPMRRAAELKMLWRNRQWWTTLVVCQTYGEVQLRQRRPVQPFDITTTAGRSYYRKRGSASYTVREVLLVREREILRETDGSDVTIVALKLAMSLHFPLPKFALGDEFTLSLAKNLHFSFLPSHFPSHPSYIVTIVALKFTIMNEFSLSIAKSFALFVPISQVARLFFPSKKWIKLIPKTIGNRKRDCAWGGSGW